MAANQESLSQMPMAMTISNISGNICNTGISSTLAGTSEIEEASVTSGNVDSTTEAIVATDAKPDKPPPDTVEPVWKSYIKNEVTSVRKRKQTSSVWNYVKELAKGHPYGGRVTHICLHEVDNTSQSNPKFCEMLLKLSTDKATGTFKSTLAFDHMQVYHPTSVPGKERLKRQASAHTQKVSALNQVGNEVLGNTKESISCTPADNCGGISKWVNRAKHDLIKAALVQWMTYAEQRITKRAVEDRTFIKVMNLAFGPDFKPVRYCNMIDVNDFVTSYH